MVRLFWDAVQFVSTSSFVNGVTLVGGTLSILTSLAAVLVVVRVVRTLPENSVFTARLGLTGLRVAFARGEPGRARTNRAAPTTVLAEGTSDGEPIPLTWQEYVEKEKATLQADAVAIARSVGLPPDRAEDILHEAVLGLARRWSVARASTSGPRAYMYRIARRRALDIKVGRTRNGQLNNSTVPLEDRPSDAAPVEDEVIRREDGDSVWAAVADLPPRQRDVVTLVKLREMAIDEVAGVLEIKSGAVRQALSMGLKNLRRRLLDEREGGSS